MTYLSFADCLNSALAHSGKSLAQIEAELRAKGFKVDKSTLNRWSNGQTTPRRDKLRLLRHLPNLLDMGPAMRLTFERTVRQMTGASISNGEMVGGAVGHQHFLGGRLVYFTGRVAELEWLKTAVKNRQSVLLCGLGGVGKTSLARKLLEEMAGEFQYGCEAISLRSGQTPVEVMEHVARRLGVPLPPPGDGQRTELVLQSLRDWTVKIDILFLLDDVQESGQIRQLIMELPDITWIITSRQKLFLPFDLMEVALMPLRPDEAVAMLLHLCSLPRTSHNLSLAHQIVIRLGSLPVAIKAASRLVNSGQLTDLALLLEWLEIYGLKGIKVEDWKLTDFLAGMLNFLEPSERDLFALCGVFPVHEINAAIFGKLAEELSLPVESLGRLANLSLITWQPDEREFHMSPLIHAYAVDCLANHPRRFEMTVAFATYRAIFAKKYFEQTAVMAEKLGELLNTSLADWPDFELGDSSA